MNDAMTTATELRPVADYYSTSKIKSLAPSSQPGKHPIYCEIGDISNPYELHDHLVKYGLKVNSTDLLPDDDLFRICYDYLETDEFLEKYDFIQSQKKANQLQYSVEATTSSKTEERDKEDNKVLILPFKEINGNFYLDVLGSDGTFGFVHEENGDVVFDSEVLDNGKLIKPTELPIHHDTNEMAFVVGVPKLDLVQNAPLLSPDELYQLLNSHVKKYCDMADLDRELHIYYALYTWFYTKCQTSPYLRYLADTGKGKSRLKDVLSGLCFYPIRATGVSTVSGVMRFHERWKGTLVIDESDLKGGMENPFIKFLNVGFEKNNNIIMSDNNDHKKTMFFDAFGPKVIAMRKPFKDNATEGRCLSYSPYETNRKDIPPELPSAYYKELEDLRAKIARFVLHHWQDIDGEKMLDCSNLDIEPRLHQMFRPLSIVVLQLYPDGEERCVEHLKARQQDIKRVRSESWEGGLFNYAYSFAMGYESDDGILPQVVKSSDIAKTFNTTSTQITNSLGSIGFEIERDRIEEIRRVGGEEKRSKKQVKKLVVSSPKKWNEIIQRYWYSEDDTKTPDCPENLRGRRWVDPQCKIINPTKKACDHGCDTCDTCDTQNARGVTSPRTSPVEQEDTNKVDFGTTSSINSPINARAYAFIVSQPSQLSQVESLLQKYDLPSDSDFSKHIKFTKKGENCICKGCGKPAIWHSSSTIRPLPLCDEHYKELKESKREI